MAGIGFRLQKLLREESYRGLVSAYVYSALISTGPWLIAVLGLALLSAISRALVPTPELQTFRAIMVYTYAGSLILTGAFQLGTTRYIADRLFVHDTAAVTPCFHFVGALVLGITALVAGPFFALAELSWASRLGALLLFEAVSLTWMGMIFLSAAKDYMAIVRAFALAEGLSVVGALTGALYHGLPGMIWGYALGQMTLAWLLTVRVRVEFPSPRASDRAVVDHWRTLPRLLGIGLFYNLGIWIDKIIFWFAPGNEVAAGILFTAPRYDTNMFFAYLSIIPSMSLFLIRIETGFYKHYAAFYETITRGGSLEAVEAHKIEMVGALRLSVIRLVKLQGIVTFLCILTAPTLVDWLGLPPMDIGLLRISLLAAFAQVLLMILLILILYFDWQRDVLRITLLFCFGNAALTGASLWLDPRFQGFGYLISCLLALVAGLFLFEHRLQHLEFDTFTRHPIRG